MKIAPAQRDALLFASGERRRVFSRAGGRGRELAAGEILCIGLLCFALWLAFDARQLFQSAESSPIGVRRTVAMTILRPIARVEEALSLDRLVSGLDRIIGKTGSPGGSAIAPATVVPTPPPSPSARAVGHRGVTTPAHGVGTKPATKHAGLPAIHQPTVAHPLTVLDVGDSIGEDLGIGLAATLGTDPAVHVLQESVGDTGLANLGYYNWIAQLPVELRRYHPQVVVVMLGGNDGQSFQNGSAVIDLGTSAWSSIYAARVAQMMSEATAAGARVIWVGLPVMGPTSGLSNSNVENQNAIYQREAARHPGVTYLSTWKLFESAAGQYETYLTVDGALVQVRDADEVHIDPPGGTNLVGSFVTREMQSLWHVKL